MIIRSLKVAMPLTAAAVAVLSPEAKEPRLNVSVTVELSVRTVCPA